MTSITIHHIDDDQKHRPRLRAAKHGGSMQAQAIAESAPPTNLAASIRARVAALGGVTLELPAREPMREPPDY